MFSIDEITKRVSVSVPRGLDPDEKEELLEEIGEYIKISMLDMIGEGRSPVTGQKWKQLKTPSLIEEKGSKLSNMDFQGDLLDALEYKVENGRLYVGWWDEDQAPKAYGHTTGMEGHPWLDGKAPVRKLIPNTKEEFTAEIRSGIQDIIQEFIDAREG